MSQYNENVLDHFDHPRNVGSMKDADGVGTEGNPGGGPFVQMFVKVQAGRIAEISFKTYGCGAAIASCSKLTEMVKEKTIEEASSVTAEALLDAIGGLPLGKRHCPGMAVSALRKAIEAAQNLLGNQ